MVWRENIDLPLLAPPVPRHMTDSLPGDDSDGPETGLGYAVNRTDALPSPMRPLPRIAALLALSAASAPALANEAASPVLAMTDHPIGMAAVGIFLLAYLLVVLEERLHLAKSKPVMLAAALIWGLIAVAGACAAGRRR